MGRVVNPSPKKCQSEGGGGADQNEGVGVEGRGGGHVLLRPILLRPIPV